jgi:uncharacterized protein YbjT (DUF2867 family)
VVVGDLKEAPEFPEDVDAAYYLVHSMNEGRGFAELEKRCARGFVERLEQTRARQVIYLSGLSQGSELSQHFASRLKVEEILRSGKLPVTVLRASIILGTGSASYQIIRDLVAKLPVMVAPKWVNNCTQPIALTNVLDYLVGVLGNEAAIGKTFDIGGPEVVTYKELMLRYAKSKGLKRKIFVVPVLTPKLSAYWLVFVTVANFALAQSLVDSLHNNSICHDFAIRDILPMKLIPIDEAMKQ